MMDLTIKAYKSTGGDGNYWIITPCRDLPFEAAQSIVSVFTSVSHFIRSQVSIVVFSIFDRPNSGNLFRDIYIFHPNDLPNNLEDFVLVNNSFIEGYLSNKTSLFKQCKDLLDVANRDRLCEYWEKRPAIFIGILSEKIEGGDDIEKSDPSESKGTETVSQSVSMESSGDAETV